MSTGVYITSGNGRYGAIGIPWLASIAYAHISHKKLFHDCSGCGPPHWSEDYTNSIIHDIILENSTLNAAWRPRDTENLNIMGVENFLWPTVNSLMKYSNNKPLPDVLKDTGLSKKFFNKFENRARSDNWAINYEPSTTIIIHVRLDDIYDNSEYPDNTNSSNGTDYQQFIGVERLVDLLKYLNYNFPNHNFQIVTTPTEHDRLLCRHAIKQSGVECDIMGNEDVEHDLWLMMNCDILIMSRSTFSMLSGLLHNGSEVFTYETWDVFESVVGAKHPTCEGKNMSNIFKILPEF